MRDLIKSKISGGESILTQRIESKKQELILSQLNQNQRDILFPQNNGLVLYPSLDFTLLYKLARHVFPEEIEAGSSGRNDRWGRAPTDNDTNLLGSIERIRICRNTYAHMKTPEMTDSEFNSQWDKVQSAVDEISKHIDRTVSSVNYIREMQLLKESPIDPETRTIWNDLTIMERQLQNHRDKDGKLYSSLIWSYKEIMQDFFMRNIVVTCRD